MVHSKTALPWLRGSCQAHGQGGGAGPPGGGMRDTYTEHMQDHRPLSSVLVGEDVIGEFVEC